MSLSTTFHVFRASLAFQARVDPLLVFHHIRSLLTILVAATQCNLYFTTVDPGLFCTFVSVQLVVSAQYSVQRVLKAKKHIAPAPCHVICGYGV